MSKTDSVIGASATSSMLSKVPEVTVWFWIIKILCTTVGESFADWINMTLGVGLVGTALGFTVVLGAILWWQLRLDRYVPLVYWLAVVVLSVTGTLYTDILTDSLGVPLAVSTAVFAAMLAVVFGAWFARERTLSIHSITTTPRELFYWLAVLITFALGTATGDWTLELTGWGPGTSVLLPAGLIAVIAIGWRLGANPVLAFWLAYILTRPLGANLGDWLGLPQDQSGLGWGVALTSVIFLAAILATVVYLTFARVDVIKSPARLAVKPPSQARQRLMVAFYSIVAAATAVLLVWASDQPHTAPASAEAESGTSDQVTVLPPGQSAISHFPRGKVAELRVIAEHAVTAVQTGDQAGATARAKDLEITWDNDQSTLQALDRPAWTVLDQQIDGVLSAIRASAPDATAERQALTRLLTSLQ